MTREERIKQYESKLLKDAFVRHLIDNKHVGTVICGGAVVDILDGRKPKDYDLLYAPSELRDELKVMYTSSTADTYRHDMGIVQILRTNPENFDFTLSKSKITIKMLPEKIDGNTVYMVKAELSMDVESYESRILIPVSYTVTKQVFSSLYRIPHWRKKGFYVPDTTYLSLLSHMAKTVIGSDAINDMTS